MKLDGDKLLADLEGLIALADKSICDADDDKHRLSIDIAKVTLSSVINEIKSGDYTIDEGT